jgi:hypothetical protein
LILSPIGLTMGAAKVANAKSAAENLSPTK